MRCNARQQVDLLKRMSPAPGERERTSTRRIRILALQQTGHLQYSNRGSFRQPLFASGLATNGGNMVMSQMHQATPEGRVYRERPTDPLEAYCARRSHAFVVG